MATHKEENMNLDGKIDIILQVEVLDKVLVDRSAGQHEPGWWVVAANYEPDGDDDSGLFFLSEEGVLYRKDADRSWTTAIGSQPELALRAAQQAEELEAIPGRPGWARDGQGVEWYSDAWIDGPPDFTCGGLIGAIKGQREPE